MSENPRAERRSVELTRRLLFQSTAYGLGGAALGRLLGSEDRSSGGARPHHPPRAKRVIYIHMVGAPSHLDLFELKPELQKHSGELCPDSFFVGKQLAFIREQPSLLGTPAGNAELQVVRCGKSGATISNLLPHLQGVADRMCFIRTLHTEHFNHAPAQLFQLTGFNRFGRPSLGSWVSFGLGSENEDLPSFVALITGSVLGAGNAAWGSGFRPTTHQGTEFRSAGDPVLYLSDPPGLTRADRGEAISTINRMNELHLADVGDPEIATRIDQYELAYRMQTSVPELMDITSEPQSVHELYGTNPGKKSFANNCLLARRLVERGVRFVQLFDQGWDHHGSIFTNLKSKAAQVDRPIAALIEDLAMRGMLDDTLVVWASEFGRTPMGQGTMGDGGPQESAGRDHHREAYTVWMAGGGVKAGHSHGETDELGYGIASDPVHMHDFNATLLHLLGMDHERLTHRYQGRRFRLTDVHGRVIEQILA